MRLANVSEDELREAGTIDHILRVFFLCQESANKLEDAYPYSIRRER